jgi:hypothetical protein
MVNVNTLSARLREYINGQVISLARENPMIGFMKPLITRAIDKNFDKVKKALDLISDKEGNVDIENIIDEMIQSVMNTNPFTFNTSFAGDIEIGGGFIKLNIPLTDKRLILNQEDIQNFRSLLIAK